MRGAGTIYVAEYYDNVTESNNASPVNVVQPDNTTGINFVLNLKGSISGTVLDDNNQPVSGVRVEAYDFDSDSYASSTVTDTNGNYLITGLLSGNYRVFLNALGTSYLNEYYDNARDWNQAVPVSVTQPANTPDINFIIEKGGSISGTVLDQNNQPISFIDVEVYDFDGGFWVNDDRTDVNGEFTIDALPTGNYRVFANASSTNFVSEYYDDASDSNLASVVSVTQPDDTFGIDFVLGLAGSISGTVLDENNQPVSGVSITAYDFDEGFWVSNARSDMNGNYAITGLKTDNYKVEVDAYNTGFLSEYYDDVTDFDLATSVSVIEPNNTPNIDFVLEKGGSISGTVLDEDDKPINGISISAFDFENGTRVNSSITDINGNYTIDALPTDNYRVFANASGTNFASENYDDVANSDLATAVSVTKPDETSGINFVLKRVGSISGRVLDANNRSVVGVLVIASVPATGVVASSGFTDVNGNYTIANIPAGSYKVSVDTSGTNFISEYYDSVPDANQATLVDVTQLNDTPNIDFELELTDVAKTFGSISGTVLDENSQPVAGVNVYASDFTGSPNGNNTITDTNGKYTITDLPAGDYRIRVEAFNTDFIREFYDDTTDYDNATAVNVAQGQTTVNIDIVLEIGGSISGTVLDENNQPIADADVEAIAFIDEGSSVRFTDFATTDANGNYTIRGLRGGAHRVRVTVYNSLFISEYYDDVTDFNSARAVNVTRLDNTPDIDFVLELGGTISGTVLDENSLPLSQIQINIFDFDSNSFVSNTFTDPNGNYTTTGLTTGNYKVAVETQGTNFINEYYDDVINRNLATLVSVTQPDDTSNIDFVLEVGGSISGTVLDENNQPISGILIHVLDFDSGDWIKTRDTDVNGNYTITGLPSSNYKVQTDSQEKDFINEFYNNVTNEELAEAVNVTVENDTSNIDFVLATGGGSISGTVLDESSQPVIGILVQAFNFDDGGFVENVITDSNGNYKIRNLPGGNYKVQVFSISGMNFANEYYDDVAVKDLAKAVNVTPTDETSNIDFVMTLGGSISGTVIDENDQPIAGINVNANDVIVDSWVAGDTTDSNGDYIIESLPAGSYRVRTDANEKGFVNENYDNVIADDQATEVDVTILNNTPDINFMLELGGTISGVIVDENDQPVEGIRVQAFDFSEGFWLSDGITDINGNYTIPGIPSGDYKVYADTSGTDFVGEVYDNVFDWDLATAVNVVAQNDSAGIDFVLELGGTISGVIFDESNQPVDGVKVQAFDFTEGFWLGDGITDINGSYTIPSVPLGDYKVFADASGTDFVSKVYDNVFDWDLATAVNVVALNDSAGIDFVLGLKGTISGIVLDGNNQPISGVRVEAFDFGSGFWVSGGNTDTNGIYTIENLQVGSYRVWANAEGTGFLNENYDNVIDDNLATAVNVTALNDTSNINFILDSQ